LNRDEGGLHYPTLASKPHGASETSKYEAIPRL